MDFIISKDTKKKLFANLWISWIYTDSLNASDTVDRAALTVSLFLLIFAFICGDITCTRILGSHLNISLQLNNSSGFVFVCVIQFDIRDNFASQLSVIVSACDWNLEQNHC